MGKAFSESEKEIIREELIKEGEKIFAKFGLKKTSIGDLTDAVGIGKGSFYAFYKSKEELFFDIINSIDFELRGMLQDYIRNELKVQKGEVYKLIRKFFDAYHSREVVARLFANSDEYNQLKRRVPKIKLDEHFDVENDFFIKLIIELQEIGLVKKEVDPKLALGIAVSINFVNLHGDMIEEKIRKEVIETQLMLWSNWLEVEFD